MLMLKSASRSTTRFSRSFSSVDPVSRLINGKNGVPISHVVGSTSNELAMVTVDELFKNTVDNYPRSMALAADAQNMLLSWEEVETRVQVATRGLLEAGISKGDRVGSWLPNLAEYFIMQYATARIGAVLVTLNPAYREKEFIHAINKVECKMVLLTPSVSSSDYAEIVAGIDPSLIPSVENIVIIQLEPRNDMQGMKKVQDTQQKLQTVGYRAPIYSELLESSHISQVSKFDKEIISISSTLTPQERINIQFTSGTTGLPKAVSLSHMNVVNNARNVAYCLHFGQATERVCIPVPLYHCFGIVMGSLACVATGNTAVFPSPTFSAKKTLQSVERHKCTALYGVKEEEKHKIYISVQCV